MEKISLDELRELLKKLGHSDEEIEEAVKSVEKDEVPEEESKEEVKVEVESEPTPEESPVAEGEGEEEPSNEPEPVESEESEGEAPVEPEAPVVEGEVSPEPEAEPVVEGVVDELPEGVEEVSVGEEPQVEPAENQVDVQALISRLDESEKAREGLQARIDALESALKEAGVLGEGSIPSKEIGVDDGTRVNDYHDDDEQFESILNKINRGY